MSIDADWFIVLKILYLLFPFLSILFSLFIYSLYTLDYPKVLLNYTIYSSLLYIIIITDTPVYSYLLLNLFLITSFLTIFFNFYALIRAIHNKREGSLIFIFGFIILILSLVNDVLYDAGIIKSRYLLSVGFFILILCQATVLALKFTFAFFKAESYVLNGEIS